ncbi:hypothetical protein WJX72_006489 [[Myrmecia] bisecta]|uniref:Uncharacterized protein n=1 Tax=[Myrmecia] bisecta TaxID=41462 RepID=A0AAW1PQL8_9CHLO
MSKLRVALPRLDLANSFQLDSVVAWLGNLVASASDDGLELPADGLSPRQQTLVALTANIFGLAVRKQMGSDDVPRLLIHRTEATRALPPDSLALRSLMEEFGPDGSRGNLAAFKAAVVAGAAMDNQADATGRGLLMPHEAGYCRTATRRVARAAAAQGALFGGFLAAAEQPPASAATQATCMDHGHPAHLDDMPQDAEMTGEQPVVLHAVPQQKPAAMTAQPSKKGTQQKPQPAAPLQDSQRKQHIGMLDPGVSVMRIVNLRNTDRRQVNQLAGLWGLKANIPQMHQNFLDLIKCHPAAVPDVNALAKRASALQDLTLQDKECLLRVFASAGSSWATGALEHHERGMRAARFHTTSALHSGTPSQPQAIHQRGEGQRLDAGYPVGFQAPTGHAAGLGPLGPPGHAGSNEEASALQPPKQGLPVTEKVCQLPPPFIPALSDHTSRNSELAQQAFKRRRVEAERAAGSTPNGVYELLRLQEPLPMAGLRPLLPPLDFERSFELGTVVAWLGNFVANSSTDPLRLPMDRLSVRQQTLVAIAANIFGLMVRKQSSNRLNIHRTPATRALPPDSLALASLLAEFGPDGSRGDLEAVKAAIMAGAPNNQEADAIAVGLLAPHEKGYNTSRIRRVTRQLAVQGARFNGLVAAGQMPPVAAISCTADDQSAPPGHPEDGQHVMPNAARAVLQGAAKKPAKQPAAPKQGNKRKKRRVSLVDTPRQQAPDMQATEQAAELAASKRKVERVDKPARAGPHPVSYTLDVTAGGKAYDVVEVAEWAYRGLIDPLVKGMRVANVPTKCKPQVMQLAVLWGMTASTPCNNVIEITKLQPTAKPDVDALVARAGSLRDLTLADKRCLLQMFASFGSSWAAAQVGAAAGRGRPTGPVRARQDPSRGKAERMARSNLASGRHTSSLPLHLTGQRLVGLHGAGSQHPPPPLAMSSLQQGAFSIPSELERGPGQDPAGIPEHSMYSPETGGHAQIGDVGPQYYASSTGQHQAALPNMAAFGHMAAGALPAMQFQDPCYAALGFQASLGPVGKVWGMKGITKDCR